jgi:putative transcriptional regulator
VNNHWRKVVVLHVLCLVAFRYSVRYNSIEVKPAMTFAQTVKNTRDSLHLSQQAFAAELGVSYATINRWENEAQKPSKLALALFYRYCAERDLPWEQIIGKAQDGGNRK